MNRLGNKRRPPVGPIRWRQGRGYIREPFEEGKRFEGYAWPTVRRNYPRWQGWVRIEQLRLKSGRQPDNVLFNEETEKVVVSEMKDVAELTETAVRKVKAYMDEVGAVETFVTVAWDTEVPRKIKRVAKRSKITIRRTWWRR